MRVITGSARGRKLGELQGKDTRPTTDKVKEALFSIIQFDIEGRKALDLFAGTGQLGIEALSRGTIWTTSPAAGGASTSSSWTRPMGPVCWKKLWKRSRRLTSYRKMV